MGDISLDMDGAIEEMTEYTKLLETILQGGTLTTGKNFKTDGLANLTGDVDKAVSNINRVRDVLQLQSSGSDVQSNDNKQGDKVINLSAENQALRLPENKSSSGENITVASANNSKQSNVNIISTPPINRINSTVSGAYA